MKAECERLLAPLVGADGPSRVSFEGWGPLPELPNAATAERLTRIEAADELFRAHVELGARCVWGAAIAKRERWTRKRQWWYFARPLRCGAELANALAPRRDGTA